MLYLNEFETGKNDIDKIKVEFPSPSSLNMTNLNEQIQNSQNLIEFLTNTLVGEQSDENKDIYNNAKRLITKDILNQFDWAKYEKMLNEQIAIDANKDKINKKLAIPAEGEEESY